MRGCIAIAHGVASWQESSASAKVNSEVRHLLIIGPTVDSNSSNDVSNVTIADRRGEGNDLPNLVRVLPQLCPPHRSQEVERTILVKIVLKVEVSWLLSHLLLSHLLLSDLLLALPWLLHLAHHLWLELLWLQSVEIEASLLLRLTGLATSATESRLVESKALSKLVLLHVELRLSSSHVEAVVAKLLLLLLLLLWVRLLTHTFIFKPSLNLTRLVKVVKTRFGVWILVRLHGSFCHLLLRCQALFDSLSKTIIQRASAISILRVDEVRSWHVAIADHRSILEDDIWQQVVNSGFSIDLTLPLLHLLVRKQSYRDSLNKQVFGKQEVWVGCQNNQLIVRHVRESDSLENLEFLFVRWRNNLSPVLNRHQDVSLLNIEHMLDLLLGILFKVHFSVFSLKLELSSVQLFNFGIERCNTRFLLLLVKHFPKVFLERLTGVLGLVWFDSASRLDKFSHVFDQLVLMVNLQVIVGEDLREV